MLPCSSWKPPSGKPACENKTGRNKKETPRSGRTRRNEKGVIDHFQIVGLTNILSIDVISVIIEVVIKNIILYFMTKLSIKIVSFFSQIFCDSLKTIHVLLEYILFN